MTELVLNSLAIFLGEDLVAIDFVFFYLGVVDNFLPAGVRMPTFRPIGIVLLRNKSNFPGILKPLGDVALLTPINQIILTRTINQLLLGQLNRNISIPLVNIFYRCSYGKRIA